MKTVERFVRTPRSWLALVLLMLLALPYYQGSIPPAAAAPVGIDHLYTFDDEFDQGTLVNVTHSPNHDQLQINRTTQPFPFVNIAASARGTVIRIDVNTGAILGEYWTAPDGMGHDPSRTTVDHFGNVWVSNRAEASGGQGSVARIGLVLGGTRTDAVGTPDPTGQYLKPPFEYNTCADRNGDGLIKTSQGPGNILPWTNAGSADSGGGVTTADDECLINYTRVSGTNTRTVAIDANNDVWVGGLGDLDHEKLDGSTGQPIPGTQFNLGCGGYGGLVDHNGVLWSARGGNGLLRFVPSASPPPAGAGACLGFGKGDYGLGLDPNTGEIWHTFLNGNAVAKLAPDGTLLGTYEHGANYAQGVVVDGSGNVWVAHSLYNATTVGHLRTDGTFVGNVDLPGGNGPTGVAVDANGKVWVANINSNNAMRIDPAAGPSGGGGFPVGAVDLTVDLGAGAGPYNYSDMTGFVSLTQQGSWSVIQDSGVSGTAWGRIIWNQEAAGQNQPPGTTLLVEARAAEDHAALGSKTFQLVANDVPFDLTGQFIEVRVTFKASSSGASPVLSDLRIRSANQPPTANANGPYSVPEGGSVTLTGSGTDPEDGPLTYAWDLDNNGSYETPGQTVTFSAAGLDGGATPSPHTVGVQVTDNGGLTATASTTVNVENVLPTVDAGADQIVYRNEVISLAGTWSDPAGNLDNSYAWTWDTTGDGVTDSSGTASYGDTIHQTPSFGLEGTYTLHFGVTDKDGGVGSDTLAVQVLNRPPVCSAAAPSQTSLWPANHRLVPINILGVTDPEGDPLSLLITGIHQDEPTNGLGDGDTSPDGMGVGTRSAQVRAERAGTRNGRFYEISFTASDGHGGSCAGSVQVVVPHDQNKTPVNDGTTYDSTQP